MKKFMFMMLCAMMFLFVSLPVSAKESKRVVGEGYTSEGIHYTIYEEQIPQCIAHSTIIHEEVTTKSSVRSIPSTMYVCRTFVFDGKVVPSQKMQHYEMINGFPYIGTLHRHSIHIVENMTIAQYYGTLSLIG